MMKFTVAISALILVFSFFFLAVPFAHADVISDMFAAIDLTGVETDVTDVLLVFIEIALVIFGLSVIVEIINSFFQGG